MVVFLVSDMAEVAVSAFDYLTLTVVNYGVVIAVGLACSLTGRLPASKLKWF